MANSKSISNNKQPHNSVTSVHINGGGCRSDRTGSACGLVFANGRELVVWKNGMTNVEAEYRAALRAVRELPEGSQVEVLSSLEIVVKQFNGDCLVHNPRLHQLHSELLKTISQRSQQVTMRWISGKTNLADKLLERARRNRAKGTRARSRAKKRVAKAKSSQHIALNTAS